MSEGDTNSGGPIEPPHITELLIEAQDGNRQAYEQAFGLVYRQLRSKAERILGDHAGATLQPTVLIHEAWMKLAGGGREYRDRHHFIAVACLSMRQVFRDHARARGSQKRAGDRARVTLGDPATPDSSVDLVAVYEALEELSNLHDRQAKVVTMRALGGLTIREVADVLQVATSTVDADWSMGRAWLRVRLEMDR